MTRLRVLVARLLSTLGLGRPDAVLSDELQLHLDLLVEDFRRQGLPDEDARAAARRAFGNEVHVREAYRRTERLPSVDALLQDLRYACRRLLADRTSTFAAAGLLTLGIASTVLMADMLDRLLMRPPPHVASPDRIARVYLHREGGSPTPLVTNYVTVEAFERGTRADLEHVATYLEERIGTGRGDRARQVNVVACTDAYFDVLGLVPALGALPATGRATPDFAVISYGFWQRHFGGSPAVLGRALRLGKGVHTIVGVTPRGFAGIDRDAVDVWVPLATRINADGHRAEWRTSLGYTRLRVIARLKSGVDRAQAALRATAVYRARPRPPRAPPELPGKEKILLADLAHGRAPGGQRCRSARGLDRARVGARPADRMRERGQPAARARTPPRPGAFAEDVAGRVSPATDAGDLRRGCCAVGGSGCSGVVGGGRSRHARQPAPAAARAHRVRFD